MARLQNLNEEGVAMQGYDPVTYFSGKPSVGSAKISSTHGDATYYFANMENKAKFDAAPEQYIPQYGGFCAVAVSEGKTFPVDPNTYKVTEGKLYLFYNGKLGNTKPQWDAEEPTRKESADRYYSANNLQIVYPMVAY